MSERKEAMSDFDLSTASTAQLAEWVVVVARGLHEYVEEQAARLSAVRVDKARAECDRVVSAAENRVRINEATISDLRSQCGILRSDVRQASEFIIRQFRHDWTPRPYSNPLTQEQEISLERGECRADWPSFRQPCDPTVEVCYTSDGEVDMSVSCALTGMQIFSTENFAGEEGLHWSDLVNAISGHRCGDVSV